MWLCHCINARSTNVQFCAQDRSAKKVDNCHCTVHCRCRTKMSINLQVMISDKRDILQKCLLRFRPHQQWKWSKCKGISREGPPGPCRCIHLLFCLSLISYFLFFISCFLFLISYFLWKWSKCEDISWVGQPASCRCILFQAMTLLVSWDG